MEKLISNGVDKKSKIAVIIVSYNGREYLPDCFNSLVRQTLLPKEIIVVDNASQDDSVKYVKEKYPQVDLIENEKNLGFAQANNQGIEVALQNKPDYIFLLNQDTICLPDCLENLVKGIEKQKNVFAVQPLILCWPACAGRPEKDKIQTAGDKIHYLGFGYCDGYKNQAKKDIIDKLETNLTYGSGAGLFINVPALEKVGFLDKDLFLYHEDLDLCLRARFLKYDIKLVPEARIYHKYTEGISKNRWYWSERNRLITLLKFYKIPTLILIFPAWLFMELGILAYSLFSGWFILKIKSYFSILLQLPKTLIKRKKIQKTRKITDKELVEYLEPRFKFAGFTHPLLKYVVNPVLGLYCQIIKKIIIW